MRLALGLLLVLLLLVGCNLFEPFYDEGQSDELDDIVSDVRAALEREEPGTAYDYAARGIEKYPESVTLHYLGALAKVQIADASFTDFADMVRGGDDEGSLASALAAFTRTEDDTVFFLDLSPDRLAEIAEAFNASYDLLRSTADLIADGKASADELRQFELDAQIGLGVSGLVVAILRVVDADNDLSNGFELDPQIQAFKTPEGWEFTVSASAEVICDSFEHFFVAQEALYDHYRSIVGLESPADIPEGYRLAPIPWVDDDTLSGEFFTAVHEGIIDLNNKYGCIGG